MELIESRIVLAICVQFFMLLQQTKCVHVQLFVRSATFRRMRGDVCGMVGKTYCLLLLNYC
jgi:hypothetical protein